MIPLRSPPLEKLSHLTSQDRSNEIFMPFL